MQRLSGLVCLALLALSAASDAAGAQLTNAVPPRAADSQSLPPQTSRVVLPVGIELDDIATRLNARLPTTLMTIDERRKRCMPDGGMAVSCRLVGQVVRGAIRVSGSGDRLTLTMPVNGAMEAREILGFVRTNEATGRAEVIADVRLAIGPDWTLKPQVDVRHRWTKEPAMMLAGKRILFTSLADRELAKVTRQIQAEVPKLVAEANPRALVQRAWDQAHSIVELGAEGPPAWLRVTPRALGDGGTRVEGRQLQLLLDMEAGVETFVGDRPADPGRAPLPPLMKLQSVPGFRMLVPVRAEWDILEDVLEQALAAQSRILLPTIGAVDTRLGRPILYPTSEGRLAVGLPIRAGTPLGTAEPAGLVWLTGSVSQAPDSGKLTVADLLVNGPIEGPHGALLTAIAQAPEVRDAIAGALAASFRQDFDSQVARIHTALTDRRIGQFLLDARITEARNAAAQPLGLMVVANGSARLRWAPAATTRLAGN